MQAKSRRRKYAAQIGGIFVALAAIGVIAIVVASLRLTYLALDNTSEKEMFSDILLPVVMFNPPPFEKATDIEMQSLLLYSMWATLLGEKGQSYQYSDTGELMIPASDLDVAASRLFGPEVKLEHQSFGDFDGMYIFDGENASYIVSSNAQYNVYTPLVEEIAKNGDYLELRVGYVPSGITWQTAMSGGAGHAAPEKYMKYTMQQTDLGYCIVKLQDIESSYVIPPPGEEGGDASLQASAAS